MAGDEPLQTVFSPTRLVPGGGVPTWPEPDAALPKGPRLEEALPVEVLEERENGWAHVRCSNGWSAWVDGRRLAPLTEPPSQAPYTPGAAPPTVAAVPWSHGFGVAAGGAVLVVVGSLLPWLSVGSRSVSAWRIPVAELLSAHSHSGGLKTGPVLLVAALLVCTPLLMRRPLPVAATVALGALATNAAALAVHDAVSLGRNVDPGVGVAVTFVGGVLVASPAIRWVRSALRGTP